MTELEQIVSQALVDALTGRSAYVNPLRALEGMHWMTAGDRPGRVRHSVYRMLNHVSFWQDLSLARLRGEERPAPATPAHGWPGREEPGNSKEWESAIARFRTGLEGMIEQARAGGFERVVHAGDGTTALAILQAVAQHNTYHLGQIVLVRRQLAAWPPPRRVDEFTEDAPGGQ